MRQRAKRGGWQAQRHEMSQTVSQKTQAALTEKRFDELVWLPMPDPALGFVFSLGESERAAETALNLRTPLGAGTAERPGASHRTAGSGL